MQSSYTVRQEPDQSWSVLLEATGAPIRLAGIPQTGLTQIEAELTLALLGPKTTRPSHRDESADTSPLYRAVA